MKTHSTVLALLVTFGLGMFTSAGASDYASDHVLNHPMAGMRPAKNFRGSYPTLTKSMQAGHVRTITTDNIVSYGHPFIGRYNGQTYWMVPVHFHLYGPDTSYQQISMDGRPLPHVSRARPSYSQHSAEAYACVRAGRVEHWIYKISKSPVR
ncbi:hypothetical protein [Prosthecobacter sp.]|uniref:hypothetical protein n=1 Tax=Prosthecobacter sp. TaxID=1965333 RepID=UPI003784675A